MALSHWRTLSAYLLHRDRSQRTALVPAEAYIKPQAAALVEALNTFLGYFVPQEQANQQSAHLQAVVLEFSKLGYVLLSHPCEWALRHSVGQNPSAIVVVAGLEKLSDKDGKRYALAQILVPPTVVQI